MKMVSIVIPTYNREKVIMRSVQSVLEQTYTDWELIIVDDGSTDATEDLVHSIEDKRIRFVKNEENRGPAYSRNIGAKLAVGEHLAFQDSDTVWHPEKLSLQMKQMETDSVDMVYHLYRMNGKICPLEEISMEQMQGQIYDKLLYCPMIGTPTMLVKKSVFWEAGGFCESLKCLEDYELSLRLAKITTIGLYNKVLLEAEDMAGSVSKNAYNELDTLFYILIHYDRDFQKHPLAKKTQFTRIIKLAKERDLMQKLYEEVEKYLQITGQTLDDMMKMYR